LQSYPEMALKRESEIFASLPEELEEILGYSEFQGLFLESFAIKV